MSYSIAGKTAIVTGASSGIGFAIARQFAENGANVMFADSDEKALVAEMGNLEKDGNVRHFAGDLRERLTVANLLSATLDAFDKVDILVNGAREVALTDPMDPDDETLESLLRCNVIAGLRLSQAVARRMIKQSEEREESSGAGTIVNLSSIAASRAHPRLMGYSVAAAALNQLTRSLAVALAPCGIRVNAVALGSVLSASLKESIRENPDYRSEIESRTPLDRIASPSELADAVQFLASDASGFMTGQVMTLDGGRTLLDSVEAPAH